jgi:hypothetical protein
MKTRFRVLVAIALLFGMVSTFPAAAHVGIAFEIQCAANWQYAAQAAHASVQLFSSPAVRNT